MYGKRKAVKDEHHHGDHEGQQIFDKNADYVFAADESRFVACKARLQSNVSCKEKRCRMTGISFRNVSDNILSFYALLLSSAFFSARPARIFSGVTGRS